MKQKKKIVLVVVYAAVILLILGAMLYPAILRAREESRKASCKNNLKNIGLLMKMYSEDYDDPCTFVGFKALFDSGVADNPAIFICPLSGNLPGNVSDVDKWTDYVLLPASPTNSLDVVVGYCRYAHDKWGFTNILYADGHVAWGPIDEKK